MTLSRVSTTGTPLVGVAWLVGERVRTAAVRLFRGPNRVVPWSPWSPVQSEPRLHTELCTTRTITDAIHRGSMGLHAMPAASAPNFPPRCLTTISRSSIRDRRTQLEYRIPAKLHGGIPGLVARSRARLQFTTSDTAGHAGLGVEHAGTRAPNLVNDDCPAESAEAPSAGHAHDRQQSHVAERCVSIHWRSKALVRTTGRDRSDFVEAIGTAIARAPKGSATNERTELRNPQDDSLVRVAIRATVRPYAISYMVAISGRPIQCQVLQQSWSAQPSMI